MSKRPGFARLQSMSSYDDLVALASGDDKGSLAQFEPILNDKAIEIAIGELHDFPNHPFKVIDDEAMKSLADSIKNRGVLHPIVVRKIDDGYQVISGHRRKMACVKAGLEKVPAYVIDLDDDEAIMLMTDANFYQREGLFPSEKAKAYRMKSDAIRRHPGIKGKYTIDEIGEGTSDSAATIKRFLRLSYLSDELLDMVDEGIIGLEQGLQVSYINDELQEQIKEVIEQAQVKMSVDHSKRLRQAYANGVLDKALIWEILMSVPPKKRKFVLKEELLRKFFDEEIPDEEIEGVIELALAKYIEMQGGVINYELHKSIKNIDTPEFERDVVAAWKIVKKYASSWNSLSALLRSRLFDEEGNVIHCARGRVQKELRNLNNELQNEATLQKIFLALKDAGFVTEYTCNNIEYRLKFKNQASKELIWDGGSVLELYTYLLQMRNSDDCKVGIHLDWDGVIQPEGVTDLLNEVDVLSLKGNIPTFISCKSGRMNSQTSLHALYELETVAQRFGGRYAKKVLALMNPMSPIYEERAREMGIEVWMMGGNETLDYYENHAESFVEGTDKVEFSSIQDKFLSYMERLRTLDSGKNANTEEVTAPLRILDFGCGSGRDTKYFLERGYEVDACDGSEHICAIASEKTGIAVKHMLFSELHGKAKYDGIWACSSILHLPKDELAEVFWRMVQAVKPGGFLYVSFKYGTYEGERNGRHFTDFTEENFRDFLEKDVRIKELSLEELWVTNDARPKRQDEKWLNAILRRGC